MKPSVKCPLPMVPFFSPESGAFWQHNYCDWCGRGEELDAVLAQCCEVNGLQGGSQAESEQGLVVTPQGNALTITL